MAEKVNHKELRKVILRHYETKRPLFIWGGPGIGKSEAVYDSGKILAKNMKYVRDAYGQDIFSFIDMRLSQTDPSDLRGVPGKDGNRTQWFIPKNLPTEGQGILFMDEVNLAPPLVQASCLPKGFYMSGTRKTIDELNKGDTIMSNDGNPTKVIAPMKRKYKGRLFTVKPRGMLPIQFTDEHPVLIVERLGYKHISNTTNISKQGTIPMFSQPKWIKASELKKGQYVLVPKLRGIHNVTELDFRKYAKQKSIGPMKVSLNHEVAELLGIYLAEGSVGTNIDIALSSKEMHLAQRYKKIVETHIGYEPWIQDCRPKYNAFRLRFGGQILARAFKEWFGTHAHNKVIPDFILWHADLDILKHFLQGYFKGDGCFYKDTIIMTTASKRLAEQLQLALARFGLFVNITFYKSPNRQFIRGREIFPKGTYTIKARNPKLIRFFNKVPTQKRYLEWARDLGQYVATPINDIEVKDWEGDVYNCETDSHTYVVGNIAVHNCYQLIHDRRIGDFVLPDGFLVLAAGNRTEDRAHTFDMALPLKLRFAHYELKSPDDDEWITWAIAHDTDGRIISFIKAFPNWLYKVDPQSKDEAQAVPRTWYFLSEAIKGMDNDEMAHYVGACIGEAGKKQFMEHVRMTDKVDLTEIMKYPSKIKKHNDDVSLQLAIIGAVAEKFRQDKKKHIATMVMLSDNLRNDLGIHCLRMAKGYSGSAFPTLCQTVPQWKTIVTKFSKFLMDTN